MIKTLLFAFFILSSAAIFAQDSINGKIYGDKAIAKYIKVSNTIKNTTTFSDKNGNFSLKASVGDSILFSSSFYEEKNILINSTHFSEIFVVQLKDKVNQLDQVVVKNDLSQREFNAKSYNKELNVLINNDIENKPWEYKPKSDFSQGVDLIGGFLYLKNRLFPKKDTKDQVKDNKNNISLGIISYYDVIRLNSNDEFFDDTFFIKELKIPKNFKRIFFSYFNDQKISAELLAHEKRLLLIEKFYEVSDKFLNTISQAKTPDNKILNDSIKNNTINKKDFD
jgi:hypothetical protein